MGLAKSDLLTIGEVASRSGIAASALRYYEDLGLIAATRTAGDRRRYPRSVLRRLAVVRAAQRVGLSLDEVREALAPYPPDKTLTKRDWAKVSSRWRSVLDARITELEQVRDNLDSCVGCGCLSMTQCALYNPQDELSAGGPGARRKFPTG